MGIEYFLQQLVNGICLGGMYALMSVGYSLVYSIMNFSNFAHGGVIMVGAYVGYFALTALNVPFLPAFLLCGVGSGLLAVIIERLVYSPLRKRHADLGTVPLLLQIGALDDWTPAPPCEALVQQLRARPGTDVELHVYPDSYHGFDGTAPVRLRTDVPNGNSGRGVHLGGNPPARAQALQALDAFWRRTLALQKAMP